MSRTGRPKGTTKPVAPVSVHMRLPPDVVATLAEIGRDRESLQHGGTPSPAKAVQWLVERFRENRNSRVFSG